MYCNAAEIRNFLLLDGGKRRSQGSLFKASVKIGQTIFERPSPLLVEP